MSYGTCVIGLVLAAALADIRRWRCHPAQPCDRHTDVSSPGGRLISRGDFVFTGIRVGACSGNQPRNGTERALQRDHLRL